VTGRGFRSVPKLGKRRRRRRAAENPPNHWKGERRLQGNSAGLSAGDAPVSHDEKMEEENSPDWTKESTLSSPGRRTYTK